MESAANTTGRRFTVATVILMAAAIVGLAACTTSTTPDTGKTGTEPDAPVSAAATLPRNTSPAGKVQPVTPPQQNTDRATPGPHREAEISLLIAPAARLHAGMPVAPSHRQPIDFRQTVTPVNRENYGRIDDNPVRRVAEAPVSTFSIDVDTGAYSNVRRLLNAGRIPVHDAVRTEELINYFNYDYPAPANRSQPFSVTTEIAPSPWNSDNHLLHIGIQGYDIEPKDLPPANLVFLIDVSGSMQAANKLGLLKSSLKLLIGKLRKQDSIAITVYAGASGTVLEPTPGDNKATIIAALDGLTAGGSTNGAAGIELAYRLAAQAWKPDGINRVLLATDGDFNVGTVDFDALKDMVARKRKTGIALTTLGFGQGNYNDHLMEQLADAGNGNHAYIDTLNEARKVLIEEMGSTLATIASDVKIQIEFNPGIVAEYRLIGYENRALRREDFNNDRIDAGEIGAGHSVTALYEITLADSAGQRIDALRYGAMTPAPKHHTDELALLRLRYKTPGSTASRLTEYPLLRADIETGPQPGSDNFRFAAAVAGFGELLRGGHYMENFGYHDVLALARSARGKDEWGYRGEFLRLVGLADALQQTASRSAPH